MPNLDPITGFPIPEERNNSGLDRMAAGMALANPISGWADRRFSPSYKPDLPEEDKPSYDPWADPRIEKYDPMHFVDSMSEDETTNLINDIERNKTTQERAVGPMGVVGTMTGVFTNPLIMLPAIASSGSSIPMMMAAESGGELLSEMILHSQQPLRTKTESALNIGLAAGAAGTVGLVQRKMAARSVAREATGTAHGGDGMYAHPIPEEATVTVPVDRADMSDIDPIWRVTATDEDGVTVVAEGLTKAEAHALKKSEEDELLEAFNTEGDFRIEKADAKEILPKLEKEVAQADDAVTKATARVEAARAKLKESGCE